MKPRTIQSLLDVREYCLELTTMIGSATVEEYLADRGPRLKTERLLEVIGEALYRADRSEPNLAEQLPEVREVTGLRNRIAHGYDAISDETVWKAAAVGVPELQRKVSGLLDQIGELPSAKEERG